MEHPGSLDITWNEEAFRKLERASAGLRPGKDRIAVVLRGTILSTPLFQGMPSRTTLIPGLGMTAGWMPCAGPSTTPFCR